MGEGGTDETIQDASGALTSKLCIVLHKNKNTKELVGDLVRKLCLATQMSRLRIGEADGEPWTSSEAAGDRRRDRPGIIVPSIQDSLTPDPR